MNGKKARIRCASYHIHFGALKTGKEQHLFACDNLLELWNSVYRFPFELRFGFIHVFVTCWCTMRSLSAKRILVCLGQKRGNLSSWFPQTLAYNSWQGLSMRCPWDGVCQQRVCIYKYVFIYINIHMVVPRKKGYHQIIHFNGTFA